MGKGMLNRGGGRASMVLSSENEGLEESVGEIERDSKACMNEPIFG